MQGQAAADTQVLSDQQLFLNFGVDREFHRLNTGLRKDTLVFSSFNPQKSIRRHLVVAQLIVVKKYTMFGATRKPKHRMKLPTHNFEAFLQHCSLFICAQIVRLSILSTQREFFTSLPTSKIHMSLTWKELPRRVPKLRGARASAVWTAAGVMDGQLRSNFFFLTQRTQVPPRGSTCAAPAPVGTAKTNRCKHHLPSS